MGLKLAWLSDQFAVCRLDSAAEIPLWVTGSFVSITRTSDELSIVCRHDVVPDGVAAETGWRAIKIAGPLEFSLVGVLNSITTPLAAAEISIFAISTYDTDYILIKSAQSAHAEQVLTAAGHDFSLLP